jgi:hypothetical protein
VCHPPLVGVLLVNTQARRDPSLSKERWLPGDMLRRTNSLASSTGMPAARPKVVIAGITGSLTVAICGQIWDGRADGMHRSTKLRAATTEEATHGPHS